MNLREYQIAASRTCPDLGNTRDNLRHMQLGVLTEIGEFLDPIKKNMAYGKELDYVNLGEELADMAWYIANEARMLGIELKDTTKIESRHLLKYLDECLQSISILAERYLQIKENRSELDYLHSFYLLELSANYLNLNFNKLLDNNIDKLRKRFPEKFSAERALNRNLEEERKELEK